MQSIEGTELNRDFLVWVTNMAALNVDPHNVSMADKPSHGCVWNMMLFILTEGDWTALNSDYPYGSIQWQSLELAYKCAPPAIQEMLIPLMNVWKLKAFPIKDLVKNTHLPVGPCV